MEYPLHTLCDLFAQLGLPSDVAAIEGFVRQHAPLPPGVALPDASIWSPAQAALLREGTRADADWSAPIDLLATLLSRTHG